MLRKIIKRSFTKTGLSARKYLRSLSQYSLHYKPAEIRSYSQHENIQDRVVQAFFDASVAKIQISEAKQRLKDVKQFSTPAHSFYQVSLPFSQNDHLRKKMVQFYNKHIRIGRVLELMDYIAANVAYRYCTPTTLSQVPIDQLQFITVTAAIDQIDFYHPIKAQLDCTFFGYVSYVGRSSMETQIDVIQREGNEDKLCCSAKFVMVARNKLTGKSYQVPKMNIQSQPQTFKIIEQLGSQRQQIRKEQSKKNLFITPPAYQQSSIVHKVMLQSEINEKNNWIPMSTTRLRNTLLMHMEDKNLSGKVFGGYLLRLAYQLGWLSAYKFLKDSYPKITHIDDVQFLGPVQIGSYVDFDATITYVDETNKFLHVVVKCHNTKITGQKSLTNILRMTFEYEQSAKISKVFPVTLSQTMLYIQSMRRIKKYLG